MGFPKGFPFSDSSAGQQRSVDRPFPFLFRFRQDRLNDSSDCLDSFLPPGLGIDIEGDASGVPDVTHVVARDFKPGAEAPHEAGVHGPETPEVDRRRQAQSAGVANLLCRPFLGGVFGDREVHKATPIMGHDQKDKQHAEGGRRHGEEVDRGHLTDVVGKKGFPNLGGRFAVAWQILGNRGLRDFDSQFEQFAVYAGRAP